MRVKPCSWRGCEQEIPASLLLCNRHWRRVPAGLRNDLLRAYRPGQEVDGEGSREWWRAAGAVLAYLWEHLRD